MRTHLATILFSVTTLGCDAEPASTLDSPAPEQDNVGSSDDEPDEDEPFARLPADAVLQVQGQADLSMTVFEGAVARGIDGTRQLVLRDGQAVLNDMLSGEEDLSAAISGDGVLIDDAILLVLDGELMVWDGALLRSSPLNSIVPFPVERLEMSTFAIWLSGAGRLLRYDLRDAGLSEVALDGNLYDFALSPDGTLWLSTPTLVGVDALSDAFDVLAVESDVMPQSMAVDQEGTLWIVDEAGLAARRSTGTWARFSAEQTFTQVVTNPWSRDVWLKTSEGALHHRDGVFTTASFPASEWGDVDELGRLFVHNATGGIMIAAGRPAAFRGLRPNEPLTVRTTVSVVPSGTPDDLTVWVGAKQLALDPMTSTVVLDPEGLSDGTQSLRVVHLESDQAWISGLPFQIGALPEAVWEDDIEVISKQQCEACHNGSTSTRLDSQALWRTWIDPIIDEVSSGEMPLGGPMLSEEEIARIRGWKQRGFP
ncbi:MAG: hypothetical protein AAFV53_18450 [Myxococcota bacterium]